VKVYEFLVASYRAVQQLVQQWFRGRGAGIDDISITAFAVGYGVLQDGEAMIENLTSAASIYICSPPVLKPVLAGTEP
jgi:hypothetical protein